MNVSLIHRMAMYGGGLLLASAGLAACSSGSSSSTTTVPATAPSTTTPSTPSTTQASATPTTAAPTSVPMQTATGGEFYSPTKNISCEVNTAPSAGSTMANGQPAQPYAYCMTVNPPQNVTLTSDGTATDCTGQQCLSNAGLNTPILAYGTTTGVAPFTCASATTGVTCTVTSGKGFQISTAGIKHIG